jgi:ATP-binding cassette subfamily F protein uup
LGYQETRELAALPERITALESEHADQQGRLADPAVYRGDGTEVKALQARIAALEAELAAAYARWDELETRAAPADKPG